MKDDFICSTSSELIIQKINKFNYLIEHFESRKHDCVHYCINYTDVKCFIILSDVNLNNNVQFIFVMLCCFYMIM